MGGWTTRELLSILDGLAGIRIIGMWLHPKDTSLVLTRGCKGGDVVEVSPVYDNAGQITVLAAAEVAFSLMQLMVETPVQTSVA